MGDVGYVATRGNVNDFAFKVFLKTFVSIASININEYSKFLL